MEPAAAAGGVAVVRGAFDWSDIGSWQAVAERSAPDGDGNRGRGDRVTVGTRRTFVHSEDRVVATVGVEDLVIVDTPDAVLVAHRDHLQRVREVAGGIQGPRQRNLPLPPDGDAAVGALHRAGRGPRLQDQANRSEAGRVVVAAAPSAAQRALGRRVGTATVTRGEDVFDVGEYGSTRIPVETKHRLENAAPRRS